MAESSKEPFALAAREMMMLATRDNDHSSHHELGLFKWHQQTHLCRFMLPYPEKPYIISVFKIASGLAPELSAALKKQSRLPVFKVHPKVEFEARKYLLGLTGDTLILLSGEDILYCLVHPTRGSDTTYRAGAEGMELEGR